MPSHRGTWPNICWLNNYPDRLLTIDHESLTVHKVWLSRTKGGEEFENSIVTSAQLLPSSRHEHDALRCYALDHTQGNFIALGFGNGRLLFGRIETDAPTGVFHGTELKDVASRAINSLSWNPSDPTKLCFAHDRGKGIDNAVSVYDLISDQSRAFNTDRIAYESILTAERVFDLTWISGEPNLFFVGTTRSLRLADVREKNGFISTTITSAPQLGLAMEPVNGAVLATRSRQGVTLYDRRQPKTPVREIPLEGENLHSLQWHPHRVYTLSGVLSSEPGEFVTLATSPRAFNYLSSEKGEERIPVSSTHEYTYATLRTAVPGLDRFCWHPTKRDRLAILSLASPNARQLTSTNIGRTRVTRMVINADCELGTGEDMAVALDERLDCLACSTGQVVDTSSRSEVIPISYRQLGEYFGQAAHSPCTIMHRRAKSGYGFGTIGGTVSSSLASLLENSQRCIETDVDSTEDLIFCWRWIDRMWRLGEQQNSMAHGRSCFPGLRQVIREMKIQDKPSVSSIKYDEVTSRNRVFTNEKRDRILRHAGWPPFNDRAAWKLVLEELMNRGTPQAQARAAALALFSVEGLCCREYLKVLSDYGASSVLLESSEEARQNIAAYRGMAARLVDVINKYDGVKVHDYEETCKILAADSYLLAIVKFLARRENYTVINNEITMSPGIELEYKIAFAAIHMDDDALSQSLERLSMTLEGEQRALSALMINGLDDHPDTHRILHRSWLPRVSPWWKVVLTIQVLIVTVDGEFRHVDTTGDIQTATILLIIGNCFRHSKILLDSSLGELRAAELLTKAIDAEPLESYQRRSFHCCRDYMELLNRWCLYIPKTFLFSLLRPKLPINNGDMRPSAQSPAVRTGTAPPSHAVIVCNYCNYPIYPTTAERVENLRATMNAPISAGNKWKGGNRQRVMTCPRCRKPLPKCVICRKHYGSQAEPINRGDEEVPTSEAPTPIDDWFAWCSACSHGTVVIRRTPLTYSSMVSRLCHMPGKWMRLHVHGQG